jgi:GT2 family glycosyltransferase
MRYPAPGEEGRGNGAGDPSNATALQVSIIYVNWNCEEEILASIAAVRQWSQSVRYEVIVVDNASPQGPGRLELAGGLRLIRSTENKGFGAGCNLGASFASGQYLLFLNPDTRFENDVLGVLLQFLETHPSATLAGPLVEDEAGKISFDAGRSLPTLGNEFLQHSTLAFRFPKGAWTSQPYLSRWDHLSTREVETVLGACMLVRSKSFHEIGGFDEKFFLYSEELDLCHRLRQGGGQIWYVHAAKLLHKERQSTIQHFGSIGRIILQNMRSQHYYFRKHYGFLGAFIWRHMIAGLYLCRYLLNRNKLHLEYFKWAITA